MTQCLRHQVPAPQKAVVVAMWTALLLNTAAMAVLAVALDILQALVELR
jgi:hypothetical protein